MTASIQDLKTAFEQYRDDVKGKVAELGTKIDALTAQLAVANTPDVTALVAEVAAAKDDLDGVVATPVPQP